MEFLFPWLVLTSKCLTQNWNDNIIAIKGNNSSLICFNLIHCVIKYFIKPPPSDTDTFINITFQFNFIKCARLHTTPNSDCVYSLRDFVAIWWLTHKTSWVFRDFLLIFCRVVNMGSIWNESWLVATMFKRPMQKQFSLFSRMDNWTDVSHGEGCSVLTMPGSVSYRSGGVSQWVCWAGDWWSAFDLLDIIGTAFVPPRPAATRRGRHRGNTSTGTRV